MQEELIAAAESDPAIAELLVNSTKDCEGAPPQDMKYAVCNTETGEWEDGITVIDDVNTADPIIELYDSLDCETAQDEPMPPMYPPTVGDEPAVMLVSPADLPGIMDPEQVVVEMPATDATVAEPETPATDAPVAEPESPATDAPVAEPETPAIETPAPVVEPVIVDPVPAPVVVDPVPAPVVVDPVPAPVVVESVPAPVISGAGSVTAPVVVESVPAPEAPVSADAVANAIANSVIVKTPEVAAPVVATAAPAATMADGTSASTADVANAIANSIVV